MSARREGKDKENRGQLVRTHTLRNGFGLHELGKYLTGRTGKLDFSEPSPSLERFEELRERIKTLTSKDAKKLGIDKSTLYTLRQHIREEEPFKLYPKTLQKLQPARNRKK